MKFRELFERAIIVDRELEEIKSIFKKFERKVKGGNIETILGLINDEIERYDIEMYISPYDSKVEKRYIGRFIGGEYDMYSQDIKIFLPKNYYEIIDMDHIKLFRLIIDTIEHELIHKNQYKKRHQWMTDINYMNQKEYLSDIDEIMAHAKSAIDELKMKYTSGEILRAMRMFKGDKNSILYSSFVITKYHEHFYKDKGQKVWKRFLKYLYQYLENM